MWIVTLDTMKNNAIDGTQLGHAAHASIYRRPTSFGHVRYNRINLPANHINLPYLD